MLLVFSEESYIFTPVGVWRSSGSQFLFNINVPCKIDVTAAGETGRRVRALRFRAS